MDQYNKLLMEIRACFPKASSVSISVITTESEMNCFSNAIKQEMKNSSNLILTMDHDLEEQRFTRYELPYVGSINLMSNGS